MKSFSDPRIKLDRLCNFHLYLRGQYMETIRRETYDQARNYAWLYYGPSIEIRYDL